ncbi:MAG: CRISPR-associated protein Csx3 [Syntrophorhabdaceae bacterium]|nr:CRISPR-associated protein Csx3 [Syntrophorhabdaceae bacterium]MDD5242903.1 CRISPR-associated protein Csx3 [Syntrophorhabdaceae bacterium]
MIKTIDVRSLYTTRAKVKELQNYIRKTLSLAGEGKDIILTGQAPIWLYLSIAHALHGRARKLVYRSPVTGDMVIFDHSPD